MAVRQVSSSPKLALLQWYNAREALKAPHDWETVSAIACLPARLMVRITLVITQTAGSQGHASLLRLPAALSALEMLLISFPAGDRVPRHFIIRSCYDNRYHPPDRYNVRSRSRRARACGNLGGIRVDHRR